MTAIACLSAAAGGWCVSLAGYAVIRRLCRGWPDEGYGLARVAGPLLLGAITWMLHAWGGLPWSPRTAGLAAGLLVAVAVLASRGASWPDRRSRRYCLTLDVIWLASLTAFLVVRSWSPSMAGAERPMDHALLASVLRATSLPATDPWLAGFPINYHHAGQILWTPFLWLCGVPMALAYNLLAAIVPAVAITAAASIGLRLEPRHWAWGAAAFACAAPPAVLATVMATRSLSAALLPSTRVMPGTVTEYPLFTFAWGDLHGHLLAIPWLVLTCGVLIAAVDRVEEGTVAGRSSWATVGAGGAIGLAAVASVLTSSWDLTTLVIGISGWCVAVGVHYGARAAAPVVLPGLLVAVGVAWPALSAFEPPPVTWGGEAAGSPPWPFLLVHGAWLLPVVAVLARVSKPRRRHAILALALVVALALALPALAVRAALVCLLVGLVRSSGAGREATALVVWAVSVLLLAEVVWVDDVYGWPLRRYNTVFKWHLHAILLTMLAMPALVGALPSLSTRRGSGDGERVRWLLRGTLAVSVFGAALVVLTLWRGREPEVSLDVLARMDRQATGEALVVRHLWAHGEPGAVVLEAPGKQYTRRSRIAALSGQPTLLGWEEHERLWRRGDRWSRVIASRRDAVDAIYAGPAEAVPALLLAHRVRYVVIGGPERERYPQLTARRFAGVADVVVRGGETELLHVR